MIEGLPLTAPIDYMHCVLLGVFPDLLKLCYKALSCREREKVNSITANLCCPREMVSFSRKVRSLEELSQFKANELFNWLFYISPVLFLDRIPPELYSHLTNLVFGIRLLLESSCNKNVAASSLLLENFCREIVLRHDGNEKIETINVHCLTHLCDQVTRFGPLFCQSAMSFESANRTLGEVFTGAHSECEIICRRILQRHKLFGCEVENEKLKPLFQKLSGKSQPDILNFKNDFVETEAVIQGRLHYPKALFKNRHNANNCYLDSPSYKRSKLGNCYVYYEVDEQETFGKILYFLEFPNSFCSETFAVVQIYSIIEELGPVKGYVYRVRNTSREDCISTEKLRKVFFFKNSLTVGECGVENFVIKLICVFEHS